MNITEARELVARWWCDKRTKDIPMDARLAEVAAEGVIKLLDEAVQTCRGRINRIMPVVRAAKNCRSAQRAYYRHARSTVTSKDAREQALNKAKTAERRLDDAIKEFELGASLFEPEKQDDRQDDSGD